MTVENTPNNNKEINGVITPFYISNADFDITI
jgi:hypothetical protein